MEIQEAQKAPDHKLIRTRWVMCNKGDDAHPDVRARLVACEINNDKSQAFFASTPPLEALKFLFSDFSSRRWHTDGSALQISFIDIRKAYFNATPTRNLCLAFPKELGIPRGYCGHLLRCVYGTRDAGLLWEECYSNILLELGFKRGVASPCCFEHVQLGLRLVVHGDDFTCTGPKDALDYYEKQLQNYFDLKIRGRMAQDHNCDKEMKILNRIVRLDARGIKYEADPRHSEILVKSLDLSGSICLTPGDKNDAIKQDDSPQHDMPDNFLDAPDSDNDNDEIDEPNLLNSLRVRCVHINDEPKIISIPAYSETYSRHPREFMFDKRGNMQILSPGTDSFTGKSQRVLQKRREQFWPQQDVEAAQLKRKQLWEHHTINGSAWEQCLVCAMRTPSAKKKFGGPSRQGAKRIRKLEQSMADGMLLTPQNATLYRALAARLNYLAQDRPDVAFCAKELCREFSAPTMNSYTRLVRAVKYLLGCPRIVFHFDFQDLPNDMNTFCDTNFAGCAATRRSTSGGVIFLGGHVVKHWSTTQTTVSLSSGEAELHGVAKGGANSIGLQALAQDLGISLGIRLHTDSSAAVGMVRRRGLGKIRHLDTTDLWLQEKIREDNFQVLKVEGAQNPADILTKYIDRFTLQKHLASMNVYPETGRAESAPQLTKQHA